MKGLLKSLIALIIIIALIFIAGSYLLSGGIPAPNATNNTTGPPAITGPSISILSPVDGEIIDGNTVNVTVSSKNFDVPRQGYYLVTLDLMWQTGNGPTFTFSNVTNGRHSISAELRNPDTSSLSPPVFSNITVTVMGANITQNMTNITNVTNATNATNMTNQTNASQANTTNTTNTSSISNTTNTSNTTGY